MSDVFQVSPAPGSHDPHLQMTPEELHIARNAPNIVPPGYRFPPYEFQQFPQAVYKRVDGSNDVETKSAKNEAQLQDLLDQGWSEGPDEKSLKAAGLRYITKMASLELHRAYEDRNMSPQAHAEIDLEQERREDFLAEMPVAPKRGRPKKDQETA